VENFRREKHEKYDFDVEILSNDDTNLMLTLRNLTANMLITCSTIVCSILMLYGA